MPAKAIVINTPAVLETKEFKPSALMIKTINGYLQAIDSGQDVSALEIIRGLNASTQNWYNWLKKDNFLNWWNGVIKDYHQKFGLSEMHKAIYKRGRKQSSADAKLYLERFDKDYKPQSVQEIDLYPGRRPPDNKAIEASNERIKAVKAKEVDNAINR